MRIASAMRPISHANLGINMVASIFSPIVAVIAFFFSNDQLEGSAAAPNQAWPCGATAIFVAARLSDYPIQASDIEHVIPVDAEKAMSLLELEQHAKNLGIYTSRTKVISFTEANFAHPLIARLRIGEEGHFVVLYGANQRGIQVFDFPHGPKFIAPRKLREIWEGHALIVPRRSVVPALKAQESQIQWMHGATQIFLLTALCLYLFDAPWPKPKKLVTT